MLLIVVAVALFSCTEAIVKILTQRYPVPLLRLGALRRAGVDHGVLFAPAMGTGARALAAARLQLWRGLVLIVSSVCFFFALRRLPLADATAIIYTTPVFVIVLSVAVLKERMTRPRGAFVAAGFVGMLLIVRPGRVDPAGRGAARAGRRGLLRGVPDPDAQAARRGPAGDAGRSPRFAARC